MNPKISVITPTHNDGDSLLRSYASLLGQTVQEWEWIVVDDGSSHPVANQLRPYNDERINVITLANRQGFGAARQAGIAAARGNFIANLDAGDWALPDRFEAQLAKMAEDPDVAVVGSFIFAELPGMDTALWRSYDDAMIHPTLLMRGDVFDTVQYNPDTRVGEDYAFTKAIDSELNWVFVDRPLGTHQAAMGIGEYAGTQLAVWKTEGPSPKLALGLIVRVAVYAAARLVRYDGKLVRRRFNDTTPDQVDVYETAKQAITAKVAELAEQGA
jgi:glycosyltransferase involved in cell wall biosynthesis